MSAAAGGMLCCAVCCTVGCLFNVVANARVTELEAKLRRAKRSHRRQLRRQRLPAGNDALRRVSSAAARRTAQVVADNVRQALLAAGCEQANGRVRDEYLIPKTEKIESKPTKTTNVYIFII